ncbi:FAD binding domain in molybdopterin dehydrogenase [delta proteobacterium NaphS2]|nr:FAD binding domain in molybdopterin dehydrogenase [delta proteobacterium NaphS2]
MERHPAIRSRFRALSQGAGEVASPQLRNQGTIGGNICQKPRCWYYRGEFHCLRKGGERCYAVGGENQYHCIFGGENCFIVHPSDTAPPLVALEAVVRIVGPQGTRSVPVSRFHVPPSEDFRQETVLAPDEMVTEIILPPAPSGLRSSYRKVRARRAWDFSLAGMALAITFKDNTVQKARVVFSGVAPVPWRSKEVEVAITGRRLDKETVARAADAAVREAEPMEKNGYKISLLRGVVEEELLAAQSGESPG